MLISFCVTLTQQFVIFTTSVDLFSAGLLYESNWISQAVNEILFLFFHFHTRDDTFNSGLHARVLFSLSVHRGLMVGSIQRLSMPVLHVSPSDSSR